MRGVAIIGLLAAICLLTNAARDEWLELASGPDVERVVVARETLAELIERREELVLVEKQRARWREKKRRQKARAAA